MSAERADRSLEERVADLEAQMVTVRGDQAEVLAVLSAEEPEDSSRAIHRAFVARIRERERQA